MRFKSERKVQPELVASKDMSRPVLSKVHLNAEASEVWVTDSYMAARFPVELDEGDTSGPIPIEALKASRKPPLKHAGGTSIRANSHIEVRHAFGEDASEPYVTLPRESSDYQAPNLAQLYPEESSLAEFEIGLNAELLAKLAKSLGADRGVKIRFTASMAEDGSRDTARPSSLKPMTVTALQSGDGDPIGLLMPIRIA